MTQPADPLIESYIAQLRSAAPATRMNAVQTLLAQGAAIIPVMKPLLHDRDEQLRRGAEGVLWRLALRHMTTKMSHALPTADEKTRHRILAFLENMQETPQLFTEDVPHALAQMLTAEHSSMRLRAAILLAGIGRDAAIPCLVSLLQDESPLVRSVAISELTFLDARAAIPDILRALDDPDPQVRYEAAYAPGRLRDARAIPVLIARLHDPDAGLRRRMMQSLSLYDDEKAQTALLLALSKGDTASRIAVLMAMKRCEDVRFIPVLLDLLHHCDWTQELQIMQRLELLESPLLDTLREAWSHQKRTI